MGCWIEGWMGGLLDSCSYFRVSYEQCTYLGIIRTYVALIPHVCLCFHTVVFA